jgi:hypothetical protein
MEKVLGLANMSEQAKQNMLRISESISSQVRMQRSFRFANQVSSMETRLAYSGSQKASKFMLYDSVPKEFAQHAGNITVTAAGANMEVVESDPEYLFIYEELGPGQEIVITYSVDTEVEESVIDSFSGEVYAQELSDVAACTEGATRCSMSDLQVCSSGEWVFQETCQYGCSGNACSTVPLAGPADYTIWIIVGALLIGGAGVVVFLLRKGSSGGRRGPVKSGGSAKPLTPGEQPYRPGSMQHGFDRD